MTTARSIIGIALIATSVAACTSSKHPSVQPSYTLPSVDVGGRCMAVPSSFLQQLHAHGTVATSAAIDSQLQNLTGREVFEVAVRFANGLVAVWSTAGSIANGGPVIPMNAAARRESKMGVDVPAGSPIVPDDPSGVHLAVNCVS